MIRSTVLLCTLFALGCDDKTEEPDGTSGTGDGTGGDDGTGTDDGGSDGGTTDEVVNPGYEACAAGEEGEAQTSPAIILSSDVTWTVAYDEEAEANGFVDCSYSRVFEGTQIVDQDYLCPDCDFLVQGTAVLDDEEGCSAVFGDIEESRTELWGISGDSVLYRGSRVQYPIGELTTFEGGGMGTTVDVAWEGDYEITLGGSMVLSAAGTMSWDEDSSNMIEGAFPPRSAPYACEWECNDPGTLELDYNLAVGKTFPNARFQDACGEWVDLWDFYGSYLVIDTSQSDCGPCRSMAEAEPAFVEGLRLEGVPVRVITLLGNGLSDPFGTPDEGTFQDWADDYPSSDPLLYDRGFAYALFPQFIEDFNGDSFGFPAWVVIDPEMTLIYGNVGFSDWDAVADVIREDAG